MGSVANCVTRSALTQVQDGCFRAPRIGQKAQSAGLMRVACNATARKKKAETAESTAGQSGDLVFAAGEKVVGHEIPPEVEAIGEGEKSIARIGYTAECEAAVNEQISIEYSISYIYHSMYSYFDRDTVALPGLAKFFQISSEEERSHAQKLMDFQNMRGGRVKLDALSAPQTDFSHDTKGDALFAMELVLSLEKLNFSKLRILHDVAAAANDAQMCDFIEGSLLEEQAADVKKAAEYVTQLRRVGKGHGAYHWDKELAEKLA